MERTEVRLSRLVLVDHAEPQYLQLEEVTPTAEPRQLTMVIGASEAREIQRCMQQVESPRPLTHELAFSLMEGLGGGLQEAVIHDLEEGTYFAELRLEKDGEILAVDCRPSDAVALTLRGTAPIFVTEQVWSAAASDD